MNFITICENVVKLLVKYWDKFLLTGMGYTLSLAAITVFFGAILGSLIALLRMSKVAPFRWIAAAYTEIIRGTPMLLQLYLFYFGLPMLIPLLNKQQYACVAIALVWKWLLNSQSGTINGILRSLGVENPPQWLLDRLKKVRQA